LYVPGAHTAHAAAPASEVAVLLHAWHVPTPCAAAVGENVSAGQAVHAVLLSENTVYVPAAHAPQVVRFDCLSPTENVPCGQREHPSSLESPSWAEYLPAPHERHVLLLLAPRVAE